jgi:hypothetical protein
MESRNCKLEDGNPPRYLGGYREPLEFLGDFDDEGGGGDEEELG